MFLVCLIWYSKLRFSSRKTPSSLKDGTLGARPKMQKVLDKPITIVNVIVKSRFLFYFGSLYESLALFNNIIGIQFECVAWQKYKFLYFMSILIKVSIVYFRNQLLHIKSITTYTLYIFRNQLLHIKLITTYPLYIFRNQLLHIELITAYPVPMIYLPKSTIAY